MDGRRDRSPMRGGGAETNGRGRDRDRPRRFSDRDRDRRGPPRDRSSADGGRRGGSRSERRVYVSNIPFDFRWQELKDLFRREIGEVAFVEVFNDESGKSRGCGIIEFASPEHVDQALEKMHRYELNGRKIVVKEDFGVERDRYGHIIRGGGMGGGGGGGMGGLGMGGRGDRVDMGRDSRRGGFGNDGGMRGGMDIPPENKYPNTYGLNVSFLESLGIDGPLVNRVFVANLDYKVDEQKLKEVFALAGKIVDVEINKDRDGNSKGHGVVEFEHPVEAVQAISMLNNQSYMDRVISVRMDRVAERKDRDPTSHLPAGLKGIGLGLGTGGKPLTDVTTKLQEPPPATAVAGVPPPQLTSLGAAGLGGLPNLPAAANSAAALGLMGAAPAVPGLGGGVPGVGGAAGGLPAGLGVAGIPVSLAGGLGQMPTSSSMGLPQLGAAIPPPQSMRGADSMAGSNDMRMSSQDVGSRGRSAFGSGYGMSGGGGGMSMSMSGGGGGAGAPDGGYGGSSRSFSDSIVVSNLDPNYTWQMLRDKFRDIGEVRFADMKGKGVGIVRFATPMEAQRAISLTDGSRSEGRILDVRPY